MIRISRENHIIVIRQSKKRIINSSTNSLSINPGSQPFLGEKKPLTAETMVFYNKDRVQHTKLQNLIGGAPRIRRNGIANYSALSAVSLMK